MVPNNTVILYNPLAALATPCFLHQMHRPQGVEELDSQCLQESTSALIRRTKSPATRSHVSRCGSGQRKTFIPRPTRRRIIQSIAPSTPFKTKPPRIFHLLLQICEKPLAASPWSSIERIGHNTILRLYWGLRPWISTFWRLDDIPIIYKGETPSPVNCQSWEGQKWEVCGKAKLKAQTGLVDIPSNHTNSTRCLGPTFC